MRHKLFDRLLALALCGLFLIGCGSAPLPTDKAPVPQTPPPEQSSPLPTPPPPTADPVSPTTPPAAEATVPTPPPAAASASPTAPAPAAGPIGRGQLVGGNTAFAFDLYRALAARGGKNLFFSPYSLSQALAMTYAGARGETEEQMAQALRFPLPQEGLHPALYELDGALAERAAGAQGKDGQGFRLSVANALWGQDGYSFLASFTDLLAQYYGAALHTVDYVNDAEGARQAINDWVGEETEGRIPDLIPPGVLNALTRLVLTNAIYFNAAWATPFDPALTRDGPFTRLDGTPVTVPLMSQTESMGYAEAQGVQAVELPYDGRQVSMVILLPAAGQFEEFEASLDPGRVEALLEGLSPRQVMLALPRFRVEAEFGLKEVLSDMGMPLAFAPEADFSGMTGRPELFVSEVLHKAFVSVDEAGTEAAAATAVVVGVTSMPAQPIEVTVDRPFLFLIRDVQTGTILFLGRVVDPAL